MTDFEPQKLHSFGNKKRMYRSSIDYDHYHILILGKVRTKNSIYTDDLAQLKIGLHHHAVTYDEAGRPEIQKSEGHDHSV